MNDQAEAPGSKEAGDEWTGMPCLGNGGRCDRENVAGREGFEPSRGLLP